MGQEMTWILLVLSALKFNSDRPKALKSHLKATLVTLMKYMLTHSCRVQIVAGKSYVIKG